MADLIRLQYKATPGARIWRNSSLTMHAAGRANMAATAKALQLQENWYAWQIVPESRP